MDRKMNKNRKPRRFSVSMKMRLFVTVVVLTVSFGIAILSYLISVKQIDTYFSRLASNSAQNFSAFLDPEFFLKLRNIAESEEFQAVRETAEKTENETLVQDYLTKQGVWEEYTQNRRKLCTYLDNMDDIKYLYIIVLGDSNAVYDMYLLDDYDNPLYQTGNYEKRESELIGIDTTASIEPTISTGNWGWLCSAYSPVYAEDGTLVCHVGCDVDMEKVMSERRNYQIYLSVGAFAVTAIVLGFAIFFTNKIIVRPIKQLTRETQKFTPAKNTSYEDAGVIRLDLRSHDEISDIYEVIRSTQMNVIDYLNDLSKLEQDNQQYQKSLKRAENDIKDKEVQLGIMSKEVNRDALTHVGSKTAYLRKADELSESIADGTAEFALVMVDLNDLKRINDQFGHKFGDAYINGCCQIVCRIFKHSPVFRIGGDEFLVILTGEDYRNRDPLIRQTRWDFLKSYSDTELPLYERYSAAVGLAVFTPEDVTFEYVFRRADRAMYDDKMRFKGENGSYR